MVYLGKEPFRTDIDFTKASVNETITGQWSFTQDIIGTAIRAKWADVAERYEIDEKQPKGTIVKFGGEKEITVTTTYEDKPFGILSTKPAFQMNSEAGDDTTYPYVALLGRVPCRVIGLVKKFDYVVTSNFPGVGQAATEKLDTAVGIALETKDTEEEDLIEIFTIAQL